MDISVPPGITQPHKPETWVYLPPICLAHRVGNYVLPINRTSHIIFNPLRNISKLFPKLIFLGKFLVEFHPFTV